jgi:opacity protein-like surface antigen
VKFLDDYDFYDNIDLKGLRMDVKTTKLSKVAIFLLIFAVTAGICGAQEYSRMGKAELFGTIQTLASEDVDYLFPDILPITLDLDSTIVYGIGYGYNFTDHWNLNTDLLFGSTNADIKISCLKVGDEDMDYVLWNVNLDYNIFKNRLTPLVTGGIGLMDFGINTKAHGLGEVQESNVSFNLGAGVRWDVKDNVLFKLIYKATWTELNHADNDQRFDGVSFSVAYMY